MSQNKNIVFLNGYDISKNGEVFSNSSLKTVKQSVATTGYRFIRLINQAKPTKDKRGRSVYYVHRLVAMKYLPNPLNLPQVNHIDGNKENNSLSNLEWVTAKENMQHAVKTGLYKSPKAFIGRFNEKHPRSRPINKLTKEGIFVESFPSLQEAKRKGHNIGNVCSALKGNYKTADGFKWEYA